MVKTVKQAFNEFLKNEVNLDYESYSQGKTSRNWLINQISKFPKNEENFPSLCNEFNLNFGSFDRRTQIQPLDDIDLMIGICAGGAEYTNFSNSILIKTDKISDDCLKKFDDGNGNISSIKMLNKFKSALKNIHQYKHAEIKRNQEAVTLTLSSDLNFDIVPCFYTTPESDFRQYYLIPDGRGFWKKTDPRFVKTYLQEINEKNEKRVLDSIKLVKFWNNRATMPSISSYILEILVINYFDEYGTNGSIHLDLNRIFAYIHDKILFPIIDPMEIERDINTLDSYEREKILKKSYADYYTSLDAINLENEGKIRESIDLWGVIFGPTFPKYG